MKQFKCDCGCMKFILIQKQETSVDFSREGAIEGHPFISTLGLHFVSIECFSCGAHFVDPTELSEIQRAIV